MTFPLDPDMMDVIMGGEEVGVFIRPPICGDT